jgi:hypothetical protein
VPTVVGSISATNFPLTFFASTLTPDLSKPSAVAFSVDATNTFSLYQPLDLNTACAGEPARLTSIEAVGAYREGRSTDVVLVGSQATGAFPNLAFTEFAAVYDRTDPPSLVLRDAVCDDQPGQNALRAVEVVDYDDGVLSGPLTMIASERADGGTESMRLRWLYPNSAGPNSLELILLDFSEAITWPSSGGSAAVLKGPVSLSESDGRLLLGTTRTWIGTDDDLAFARFIVSDLIRTDGFEEVP